MSEELNQTTGLIPWIEASGYFEYKKFPEITVEDLGAFLTKMAEQDEQMPTKIRRTIGGAQLLSMDDERFKIIFASDIVECTASIETHGKILARAESLGLIDYAP